MATVTGTKRLLDITGDNITTAVSLEAEGTLLDSNGTSGTSGQLLSSTGTGVDWVSNNSGSWDGIYSGSAQITGSLGVTGSIFIKGDTEIFDFNNTTDDHVSFRGDQVNITKADDSIYASFGIGAGGQFTFQNPNLIVLGDDEGIDTGMILELDMTGPSMTLNGGTYFQSFGSGGDLWTVHDTDLGIRTKIESDGLGSDNSFWQKGGSNTNYSHVIGYEFGTNNDLKIGFDNCYNIDLFPTNLVNLKNGNLSVFRGTTFTSTIFLGGNSSGGTSTGVNFQYSPSGLFQINDSNIGEGFFQKGSSTLDIKIGDFDGVINETYIEIDDTNSRVLIPNGNVGIGTTSPGSKLEVQGELDVAGGDGYRIEGTPFALFGGSALRLGDWDGNNYSTRILGNNGVSTSTLSVTGTGVGIGTTSPTRPLSVYRSTGGSVANFLHYTDASNFAGLYIDVDQATDKVKLTSSGNAPGGFSFYTATSERLTISTAGNVGIGDATPNYKLDVNSGTTNAALRLKSTDDTVTLRFEDDDSSYEIRESAVGLKFVNSSNVTGVTFLQSGNVGIGTSSPSSPLHIEFNSTSTTFPAGTGDYLQVENTNTTVDTHSSISLRSGTADSFISTVYKGINTGDLVFSLDNGGIAEKMRILANGNVGIGTASPTSELHIATASPEIKIEDTSNLNANIILDGTRRTDITQAGTKFTISDQVFGESFFEYDAGSSMNIKIGDTNFANETHIEIDDNTARVLIPNGSVGIGTTAPSEELHVAGRAIVEDRLAIGGDFVPQKALHLKNAAPVFRFEDSDITGGYLDMIKTSRNMKFDLEPTDAVSSTNFDFKIGGTTHLYMKNSQVGIMNDSPTEALDITGNVQAETLIATDLTDGYVPYSKSGTLGLQDSKIYTQGAAIAVGTTTLAAGCHITSLSDISATGYRVSAMQTAPATRNSTGTLGEIRITSNYIYVCYATDSWSRVALATSW